MSFPGNHDFFRKSWKFQDFLGKIMIFLEDQLKNQDSLGILKIFWEICGNLRDSPRFF